MLLFFRFITKIISIKVRKETMRNKCLTSEHVEDLIKSVLLFGTIILFFIFINIVYTIKSIRISQVQVNMVKELKNSQEDSCGTMTSLNTENMMTIKNLANENFTKTTTIVDLLKSIKTGLDRLFFIKPENIGIIQRFH